MNTSKQNTAILSHNCSDKKWVANCFLHTSFRSYRDSKGTKWWKQIFISTQQIPTKPTGPLLKMAAVWGSLLVRTVAVAHLTDARGSKGCFPCDWWFFHRSETEDSSGIFSYWSTKFGIFHQWGVQKEFSRKIVQGFRKVTLRWLKRGDVRFWTSVRHLPLWSGVQFMPKSTDFWNLRCQIVGKDTPEWSCLF